MFALGGYVDGNLAGFAHYLFHRSTWAAPILLSGRSVCRGSARGEGWDGR